MESTTEKHELDQKMPGKGSVHEGENLEYSPEQEKAINTKIDKRLLPLLAVMYIMSYLDRSNIGNAAIIGLREDLNLTPTQYNLCLTIFFIPYSLFEIPSNLMLKLMRPSYWIGIMMITWGVTATLAGLVQDFKGLMIVRVALAIGEAGFFPAASYILTTWYRRHEIQFRASIFYSAGALAGAVSGLLAYLINKMNGIGGLEGWRWVFILEGILTVLVAVAAPFLLPDDPQSCKFLTPEEKAIVAHRLRYDTGTQSGTVDVDESFKWKYVWDAILDYKVWLVVVVYWGSSIPLYGLIYTLPTVILDLGYEAEIAQLLTIPIYVFAVIVLLVVALFSDRAGSRSAYVIGPLIVGLVGYIGLVAIPKAGQAPGALYAMLFLVAAGLYAIVCGTVAWVANNLAGPWKRSVGMALMIAVGNLGGAVGTNIYLTREAPYYWTGFGVSLAVVVLALGAALALRIILKRINAKRDAMSPEEIHEKYTEEQLLDMGDDSPLFRYTT